MSDIATKHAVCGFWNAPYEEARFRDWVESLRQPLQPARPTLALLFLTPSLFARAAEIQEIVQVHGQVGTVLGCSSTSVISGGHEWERKGGLALGLYHLPDARLRTTHLTQAEIEEANGPGYWYHHTGVTATACRGWLAFADPFRLDCEAWVEAWNEAYPGIALAGGLASGDLRAQQTQLYLDGAVHEEGAVAVALGGGVELATLVSQGCTPIGEPWTITKVDGNLIHQIGNQPAYQVLVETFNRLPEEEQRRAQGNLLVGFVVNEYQEEYHRGDFLIRNLLGGDPDSGILAVGARPRPGQALQFQCRDAAAATEDMAALLRRARQQVGAREIFGACLCVCNGRGRRLFGTPDHDARMVQQFLGPLALTGFFCNGEIGPVGNRNFLHGYTASLALFLPARDEA